MRYDSLLLLQCLHLCKKYSNIKYECGKRNYLYSIRTASFVSIVMYLTCIIILLLKKQMV